MTVSALFDKIAVVVEVAAVLLPPLAPETMSKVSLCMIVKNEESILDRSLQSVYLVADEIVITDTGSDDSTIDIAKKYTDNISRFKWIDDFSAARNYCSSFAHHEYIMTWDADNILDPKSLAKILELKRNNFNNHDLLLGSWHIEVNNQGKPIKTLAKPFIYRRDKFHWESPIHNMLVVNDGVGNISQKIVQQIHFTHHKDRIVKAGRYKQTLKILERELKKNYKDSRLLFFYGEALVFEERFEDALKVFNDYLEMFKSRGDDVVIATLEKIMYLSMRLDRSSEAYDVIKGYEKSLYKYPRYLLLRADIIASVDFPKSMQAYRDYLSNPVPKDNPSLFYDVERHYVHPRVILASHYIESGMLAEANVILTEALSQAVKIESKERCKDLLQVTENIDI